MATPIYSTLTTIRQDVYTDKAAAPFQHVFSQAIRSGNKIYCSGSVGLSTKTGTLVEGGIQAETVCPPCELCWWMPRLILDAMDGSQERVLDNLEAVLNEADTGLDKVIKVNVYLKDIARDFSAMNEVYVRRFAMPMPVSFLSVTLAPLSLLPISICKLFSFYYTRSALGVPGIDKYRPEHV